MEEEGKPPADGAGSESDDAILDPLPRTYGELQSLLEKKGEFNPYEFRRAAMAQIQSETERPLPLLRDPNIKRTRRGTSRYR